MFKNKTLFNHIILGIFLVGIPILSSPELNKGLSLFSSKPFIQNFISYIILVCFLFLHYYVLMPKLYETKKKVLYLFAVFFILGCMILLPKISINAPPPPINTNNTLEERGNLFFKILNYNDGLIFQFIIIWVLSISLKTENKVKEIKNQKLSTELSYLKAQINSHFLFNTLNNIYSLSLNNSEKTPNAILKLSQIMRYVVTESDTEKVPLAQELEYIKNYIDLQRLRLGEQVELTFTDNCRCNHLKIAPIILINFIENAFKYGVNPEKKSSIYISISTQNKQLTLEVKNDIVVYKNSLPSKTKKGLINTQQRLKTIYHNKHNLQIHQKENQFLIQLILDLDD